MNAAMPSVPDAAEWRDFLAQPAAYAHNSRLAACFNGTIDAQFCEQLAMSPRLRGRLSAMLAQHYTLPDWTDGENCDDSDRAIAVASARQIAELAHRSGAIYWAASIATAILAHEVEAYHKQLGRDLCTFALTNRDLCGPKQEVSAPDNLRNWVQADGWRCVEAWRRNLPESVGRRVLLKLAPNPLLDMPPGRTFTELGPAIVQRAANLGGSHG